LGYKVFSLYAFNQATKELQTANKEPLEGFKKDNETSNQVQANLLKVSDAIAGKSNLTQAEIANIIKQVKADYKTALSKAKSSISETEGKIDKLENFNKMPLWLSADQKKFTTDAADSLNAYLQASKDDYTLAVKLEPFIEDTFLVLGDTASLMAYFMTVSSSNPQNMTTTLNQAFTLLSPLEKYTKPDFKFAGEATLASRYQNTYKAYATFKTFFGQSYVIAKAASQGDLSQFSSFNQIAASFSSSMSGFENPFSEISADSKQILVKEKDAMGDYIRALDFYGEKKLYSNLLPFQKVTYGNNHNKALYFIFDVELYQLEKQSYPKETSFSDLIATLKGGLADPFDFNKADFTYESNGSTYFELGYKDEISGKMETITVGTKTESQKSLGVTTQGGLNLDSVLSVADYFKSLLH